MLQLFHIKNNLTTNPFWNQVNFSPIPGSHVILDRETGEWCLWRAPQASKGAARALGPPTPTHCGDLPRPGQATCQHACPGLRARVVRVLRRARVWCPWLAGELVPCSSAQCPHGTPDPATGQVVNRAHFGVSTFIGSINSYSTPDYKQAMCE